MMLIGLALLVQTAELPANTADAARICAAIEIRSMAEAPNLIEMSRGMHFSLLAARETRGTGRMLDNFPVEMALVLRRITESKDDPTLRGDCRKRFPQAWAASAKLPETDYDRATLCFVATGFTGGLASSLGDGANEQRWRSLSERLKALPVLSNTESGKRGFTSNELLRDHDDKLIREALDTSGLFAVAEACEAAYPI